MNIWLFQLSWTHFEMSLRLRANSETGTALQSLPYSNKPCFTVGENYQNIALYKHKIVLKNQVMYFYGFFWNTCEQMLKKTFYAI